MKRRPTKAEKATTTPAPRGRRSAPNKKRAKKKAALKAPSAQRSRIMRAVRSKDTAPELALSAALRRLGVRHRRNVEALAGTPDVVIDDARLVVFVHGCFWHGHGCPRGSRVPRTNRRFWLEKVARNRRRDRRVSRQLRADGWSVWTVWECELKQAGGQAPARLIGAIERHRERHS